MLGLTAGLLAGPIVGLLEALFILTSGAPAEYVALIYATVLYAAIGAGMGLGCGVGVAILGLIIKRLSDAGAYTLSFVGVFSALGVVISLYIVNKVVYLEQGVPMQGKLLILAVFGLNALLDLWLIPLALTKTRLSALLTLKGTAIAYGVQVVLAAVFSFAPASGDPDGFLSPGPTDASLADQPNVMLIMVDTLRADYLGTYGMEGASPEIDKFSNDAIVFEQAIAQASWTRPSTATLFSSMQPSRHSTDVKVSVFPDEIETVAEVFQNHGYNTGGLPNNINVTRSFNFQQGFDYFSYQAPDYLFGATESASQLSMYNVVRKLKERVSGAAKRIEDFYQPATTVLANAQGFIEANQESNWFLFVHLMEPHDPYFEYPFNGKGYGRAEHENPDPADKDYMIETYKGEILELDDQLGQFFTWMKSEGLYDNTVVLLTSDHGEEFFEHGGWWHGTTLYDEQIRIPLIVKLPNQEHGGTRVPWQVRHIDVAPTLTAQVGAGQPETWQGADFFDSHFDTLVAPKPEPTTVEGEEATAEPQEAAPAQGWDAHPGSREAIAEENFEGNVLSAIRADGYKLIKANEGNARGLETNELYHVAADVGETKNLAGSGQAIEGQLNEDLKAAIINAESQKAEGAETEIDAATEERLRALGYIE